MSKRCLHVKSWDFNLPTIYAGARGRGALPATSSATTDWTPDQRRRIRRSHGFGHGFQHSAEIAVGRENRRRVLFKRGAHDIEAAQKRIEFLLVRRAKSCGVNLAASASAFAFNLKRILCGGGTDRGDVAFFLAVDVRRLATSLGTESGRDLVPLARHALDDFLRHRRVVFAAFKTFVEQFDPKSAIF
jgi:hypothetical protein